MEEKQKPKSLFFPLLLICVGILIFLVNIDKVSGTPLENLWRYWPVILIVGGLDGLYKRDGWVGPLVLLGLGTILLLGNLGYIEAGGFALLIKLWPVLLVAIGLDIIFGHKGSIWSNFIRIFLGVLLVAGILWLTVLSPSVASGMKTVPFSQTLDGATSSEVSFSVAVGELELAGNAPKNLLVDGTACLPKGMDLDPVYSKPVDGNSSLKIKGDDLVIIPFNTTIYPWEFSINSDLPIDLSTEMGVGALAVDLTGTQVNMVRTEMGIGQTVLTLPEGIDFEAEVEGAIGELVIRVPKGSRVMVQSESAIVGIDIPDGYLKNGNLITSTETNTNAPDINLRVDLAIGSIVIEEID